MPTMTSVSSERLQSEAALSLIEQAPECVKLLSASGHLHYMSETGMALMEINDFDAVKGQMWWDLWPDSCRNTLKDAVAAASNGVQVVFEAACPTAAGTPKHWRVRVSAVKGGQLNDMIVAYSQDITAEKDLKDARKQLQTENLALEHFTRVAAHDLRGPIRHNKLLAELILSACGDGADEVRSYAEEIERSSSSMLTLLQDLEAFHMHNDQDPADFEPVALEEAITEALNLLDASAADIQIVQPEAPVHVLGHKGQLVSVFKNVLENAIKYHEGTEACRIMIVTKPTIIGVEISISDNGAGFPRRDFKSIFDPRVRQENSAGKPGSGLGLSIVRMIVDAHGGEVWAQNGSDSGLDGANISLRLPALTTH